jgi:hypothetical protein
MALSLMSLVSPLGCQRFHDFNRLGCLTGLTMLIDPKTLFGVLSTRTVRLYELFGPLAQVLVRDEGSQVHILPRRP